ncbi:hypothetical protein CJ030_MR3G006631 [Morella rubra]|uniref:Myb/SANT-like domain-containing protein n=1 Tax=Morella rubra TaxID=262757 RepID=A0A6A1W4K5_9ROSI|nr:hypothetical protein CJ030_MR3G006631 [Morella rubra]
MAKFNLGCVTNGKLGAANYEYIASIMKVDVPCLDGQKIKTKIENLRNEYRAFNNLRNRTGFGWDPTTQTVIADVPQWTEVLRRPSPVPSASGLRKKQSQDWKTTVDPWEEASQNYLWAKADRITSSYIYRTSLLDECIDGV